MIDKEKIIRMNALAMALQSAKDREAVISRYTRRDYLTVRLLLSWLCASISWLILSAMGILLYVGENQERFRISEHFGLILSVWIGGYVLFCAAVMFISFRAGGERYRKAKKWQSQCGSAAAALAEYYDAQDRS